VKTKVGIKNKKIAPVVGYWPRTVALDITFLFTQAFIVSFYVISEASINFAQLISDFRRNRRSAASIVVPTLLSQCIIYN
jgi:hypothetical protein